MKEGDGLGCPSFFSIFVVMTYLYIGIYLIVVWGWVGFEMLRAKGKDNEKTD